MSASDPGVSLKTTTLEAALALLAPALDARFEPRADLPPEAADAIEALALPAGLRSRRVLLGDGWWREPVGALVARVAERRRTPRGPGPAQSPSLAAGAGWVALVPDGRGYRMRALDEDGGPVDWPVDADLAARLSPFAFTFHRRFARRVLGALDIVRFGMREGRADLALVAGAGIVAALVGLLTPMATGWLIDRAIPHAALGPIAAVIAGLAMAGIALAALEMLRTLAILRFEARTAVAMQAAIVDRVVSAPPAFFRAFASGDLALRVGSVNTVQRTLTGAALAAFVTTLFAAASAALMIAYSAALTAGALVVIAAAIGASVLLGLARLRLGPRLEALDGRLAAITFELFAGIAKLRASAAEIRAFDRWHARYDAFRTVDSAAARIANRESVILALLTPLATAVVLFLAWRASKTPSALTAGEFVAFHAALFGFLGGVQALVGTALDAASVKPVWDRARPILEALPEDAAAGVERHEPQGGIALDGVSFAYPGGPEVLAGIGLHVRAGEFVAVVGPSGSGKSTLLRLLLGFEKPSRGSVRYDGHDLAAIDVPWLRRRIGTVLQGGKLWAGDLYTNILGATSAGLEAAWDAARRAGLAADIEAMPMGMYTVVGEGVSTLSGGQRQRVLIARALVGAPRVLLLDEATSALDNVSQKAVLDALAALSATRIVIAHRLDTVRDADRIVVLERGRIVQEGTFRELAASEGPFAALLARQVA